MKRKVINMVKRLEQLEKYFVEIGVDNRIKPLLFKTLSNYGADLNERHRLELCTRIIALSMECGKNIPDYVKEIISSSKDSIEDYFDLRTAMCNAIATNNGTRVNW